MKFILRENKEEFEFKSDILDKFKDLIEIENLGHNL